MIDFMDILINYACIIDFKVVFLFFVYIFTDFELPPQDGENEQNFRHIMKKKTPVKIFYQVHWWKIRRIYLFSFFPFLLT